MLKTFLARHLNKLFVGILSLSVIILVLWPAFDNKSAQIVDDAFTQAMVVFGTAKALNGVISLAQGTEVGPPGVTVSIGEILDPINDLVEQFSWIMLASMTSLGIQKILMNIFTHPLFDGMIITVLLLLNLWLLYRFKRDERIRDLFFKFSVVLVFLRIGIPLMAFANAMTYEHFVQPTYNIAVLEKDIDIIAEDVQMARPKESGWSAMFNSGTYTQQIEHYTEMANRASSHIVHLIIAFVFQTILFPIVFLFLLYQFIRKVFGFGS